MTATPLGGFLAVPLADLHASPGNPRTQLHGITELAASIRARGLIQPLIVHHDGDGGYQIIAGHRRRAALERLGWATAPCVLRRDMPADEELLTMIVENDQREGLDPIEEARAFQTLRGRRTILEVAQQIGRPPSFISNRLLLLELPIAQQEELRAGHINLAYATTLVRGARMVEREKENPVARPVGRPKGATTKPYFGSTHPLAATVRRICDHRGTPKLNKVGCGPCWETAIRADAQAVPS